MKKLVTFLISFVSVIAYAQNVGIGVPNPQNKLHVGGGLRLDTLTGVGGAGLLWHNPNGVVYGIKFTGNTSHIPVKCAVSHRSVTSPGCIVN